MAENNNDDFKQMSKEEKDKLAHKIVMDQFLFAKTIASAFGGGQKNKEIVKFIMEESTKKLERYLGKKMEFIIIRGDDISEEEKKD